LSADVALEGPAATASAHAAANNVSRMFGFSFAWLSDFRTGNSLPDRAGRIRLPGHFAVWETSDK